MARRGVTPGDYSVEQLSQDVLALADRLGIDRFAFCGLSLGGMIGQWLAVHAPGRVTAVVLANTSPKPDPERMEARRRKVLESGMSSVVDEVMGRFLLAAAARVERPAGGRLAADAAGDGSDRLRRLLRRRARHGSARHAALDPLSVLVVDGELDVSLPWKGHGEILARDIPGAAGSPPARGASLEPRVPARVHQRVAALPRRAGGFDAGCRHARAPPRARRRPRRSRDRVDNGIHPRFPGPDHALCVGRDLDATGLDLRTRRLLVLAITAALGRWEEYRLHVRTGLPRELEWCDLEEVLLQTAIYAGVPAANTGFQLAIEESSKIK
jgi:3-oxoadipate enol-lactonase/4-carboxymuconolactone decarboxylase